MSLWLRRYRAEKTKPWTLFLTIFTWSYKNLCLFQAFFFFRSSTDLKTLVHEGILGIRYVFLFCFRLMSGSCHLDRASNYEFSVARLLWFFQLTQKSDLKVQITKNDLCAPNCKTIKKIFNDLSKWHEPDKKLFTFLN